jgi:predicted alpha/beta superfamily hydrolase
MKITHLYALILLFPLLANGQNIEGKVAENYQPLCMGTSETIYSQILKEPRTYWVSVPAHYNDSIQKQYPVVYLLDGDVFFNALVAIHRYYSGGRQPIMPECIIVGILNTDRTRDLTPSKSAYRRDGKRYDGDKEIGGGSENFTFFLCHELCPAINQAYRTNGHSSIVGHSFGGLFVMNTLLHHSEAFNTYIAIDPSFWWDNGKLKRDADVLFKTKRFDNARLYIGIASQIQTNVNNIHREVANDFLHELLPIAIENGLSANWKTFPDESHSTIPIPGMLDAFKIMFKSQ